MSRTRFLSEAQAQPAKNREFQNLCRRLRPSRFGTREPHKEESSLYDLYVHSTIAMLTNSDFFIPRLIRLFARGDSGTRIEDLRKLVILALLGTRLDKSEVADFLRREFNRISSRDPNLRQHFQFTFALNTKSGRQVVDLPADLCELIRACDGQNHAAYRLLQEFLQSISPADAASVDPATAQFIDFGGRKTVFRIQFKGRNAALLIPKIPGYYDHAKAKTESDLYSRVRSLGLSAIHVPEVFGVIGRFDEGGLAMEDCTKGGNAFLTRLEHKAELYVRFLAEHKEDIALLVSAFGDRIHSELPGLLYLQTSRKTEEERVIILDLENLESTQA